MRTLFTFMCVLALGVMGCGDAPGESCGVVGSQSCWDRDSGQLLMCSEDGVWVHDNSITCTLAEHCVARDGVAICVAWGCDTEHEDFCTSPSSSDCDGTVIRTCKETDCPMWTTSVDCADSGQVCTVETTPASCVAGSGGTGGTGGTAGSGGTAGTGGTGGGVSSCAEVDIADLPQLAGMLSLSPDSGGPDAVLLVTAGVDPDTEELTATILNESSGFPGGSCFVLAGGNETVECDLRVETVAQPGPHVLELELRADPLNRLDYVRYTPGDGNTYVRIKVENNVPGPETATTCLVVNADIQF